MTRDQDGVDEIPSNLTFEGFEEEARGQVGRGLGFSGGMFEISIARLLSIISSQSAARLFAAEGSRGSLRFKLDQLHALPSGPLDPIILPLSSLASPTPTLASPSVSFHSINRSLTPNFNAFD